MINNDPAGLALRFLTTRPTATGEDAILFAKEQYPDSESDVVDFLHDWVKLRAKLAAAKLRGEGQA